MAEEVIRYKSKEGKEFTTPEEADLHDNWWALKRWYEDTKNHDVELLATTDGAGVTWNELSEWMGINKSKVREILDVV